jgi:hypothetical protein
MPGKICAMLVSVSSEQERNKTMNLARAWPLAAALCLAFPRAYAEGPPPSPGCELKQFGTVDLTATDDGVLVPVTLNGQHGFMVLNTSSGFTVVWDSVVDQAKWPAQNLPTTARIAFGRSEIRGYVDLDSLALGGMNLGKAQLMIAVRPDDLAVPASLPAPIVGALGIEVFAHIDFELDLAHGKLRLFSQDHCPQKVVYWTDEYASVPLHRTKLGTLTFPMELEGRSVEASLAPGQKATTLTTDVTKRVYGFDADSAGIQTEIRPDGTERNHYMAMKMTAPGLTVTNPLIELREPPARTAGCELNISKWRSKGAGYEECLGFVPLKVGRNLLRALRLYFATKENVLYFSAANATK